MRARNAVLVLLGLVVATGIFLSRRTDQASPRTANVDNLVQLPATIAPQAAATQPAPQATTAAAEPVPPYLSATDAAGKLPRALPASDFKAYPIVARAYRIAERIPTVLAQQPCYCHCDKFGHGSLLDCFASDHGAGWAICVKEVLLADRMTRAGKKPAEIREAIIRGDWQDVSVDEKE